ncbi:MAG: hypothetical protein M1396_06745 [Chloroflexi bacterium]|nr:hypothetical protein [Chloroflexota bacterium]
MDHVRLWRMQQEFRWLLISLLAQFLLGMVANLWVVIPARHPGTHAANYFLGLLQGIPWALASSNLFLRLHIAVGVMLWVLATLLLIEAIRWHDRSMGSGCHGVGGHYGSGL